MSTYELNFAMPYAVTTACLYLDVKRPVDGDRQYVIGVRAMAGTSPVDLDSPGWHFSERLQTKFCYLPSQGAPGIVKLPPLVVGREISVLEITPRAWARGVLPVDDTIASVWAVMPDVGGSSTVFQLESLTEAAHV